MLIIPLAYITLIEQNLEIWNHPSNQDWFISLYFSAKMLSKEERIKLIKQIEEKTNSKVLVYFTGDRQGLETRISHDVIPIISKHISKFNSDRISLFIYTPGGITVAGYGIVNLIREHCKELHFIIPYKCLSTGTLMALGGNSIMMSKMAQLGPVDPSTQHPLAPSVPISQNPTVPVSVPVNVEDVMSYFDLAKAQCNISTQDNLTEIFISIAEKIHPLVLGAVNKT